MSGSRAQLSRFSIVMMVAAMALALLGSATASAHGKHHGLHHRHTTKTVRVSQRRVTVAHIGVKSYKTGPRVAGLIQRRGGYSYRFADTFVVPETVDQGGPFDSGFFFRSNVTAYGSQAPYMN
jgi:hypothetical protein